MKYSNQPDRTVKIPTENFPVLIPILQENYPAISGRSVGDLAGRVVKCSFPAGIDNVNERLSEISREHGADMAVIGNQIGISEFHKLVAKIGHAFTFAALPAEDYEPILTDYILGLSSHEGELYVGNDWHVLQRTKSLHKLEFVLMPVAERVLIFVRVRLFENIGLPAMMAGVGWLRNGAEFPTHAYIEPAPVSMRGKLHADGPRQNPNPLLRPKGSGRT